MLKICQAYPAFYQSFKRYLPETELIFDGGSLDKSLIFDSDLIIFSGGEDINPMLYGETVTYSYYNAARDLVELDILRTAIGLGKKILGVCRGHQLVNAYLGGKLVQDLRYDLQINHPGFHKINEIAKDSIPDKFFQGGVNSLHHQGVIKEGDGLFITSTYGKVIESTENDRIITVQWHPEFMPDSYQFFEYIREWSTYK